MAPNPGYTQTMTEDAIRQRSEASRKHGAYALEERGEAALTESGRSRLAELKEQVNSRGSALELLKEQTARSVMVCELALGYVSERRRNGAQLEHIAVFRALPAFLNTAQRALRDLIALLPDDKDVLDAQSVLETIKGGQEDDSID